MDITHSYSKLLLVLVILILTNILLLQFAEAKEIPSPVTQGFIQSSDSVELSYQIRGSGADTLFMLHGGPGADSGYLAPDLEPLEETFTLIYYDQRGTGKSTLVSESDVLTIDAHVGDLEAIRNYFGLEKLKLFGHSWGSLLASFYSLEHPAMLLFSLLPERAIFSRLKRWRNGKPLIRMPGWYCWRVPGTILKSSVRKNFCRWRPEEDPKVDSGLLKRYRAEAVGCGGCVIRSDSHATNNLKSD